MKQSKDQVIVQLQVKSNQFDVTTITRMKGSKTKGQHSLKGQFRLSQECCSLFHVIFL